MSVSVSLPLIILVIFALVVIVLGLRTKIGAMLFGLSVVLVFAYFALAIMAPGALANILATVR